MIVSELIRLVEFECGLEAGTIAGPSRFKPIVRVRTAVCRVLRDRMVQDEKTGREGPRFSLPMIGRMLKRDHSTIVAAIERAERLMQTDAAFRDLYARISALVAAGDVGTQLVAAQVAAAAERMQAQAALAEVDNGPEVVPIARTRREFIRQLQRKVRSRNDMIEDDQDGLARARASMALVEAIQAARAA